MTQLVLLLISFTILYCATIVEGRVAKNGNLKLNVLAKLQADPSKLSAAIQDPFFQRLDRNLENYDPRVAPSKPVKVSATVYIEQYSVDDSKMQHGGVVYLTQEWVDERLKFNSSQNEASLQTSPEESKIWLPDTFFQNEVSQNEQQYVQASKFNSLLRIFPDGSVRYNRKFTTNFLCAMDFHLYPHDRQTCTMEISSFGRYADEIEYKWKDVGRNSDPVMLSFEAMLKHFSIESFKGHGRMNHLTTGSVPVLETRVELKRLCGKQVLQIYVPSVMLVCLAYLSLWIEKSNSSTRVFLATFALGLMFSLALFSAMTSPSVQYVRVIDLWNGICLMIVFIMVTESVVINFLMTKHRKEMAPKSEDLNSNQNNIPDRKNDEKLENIDYAMRVAVSVVFFAFAFFYFHNVM